MSVWYLLSEWAIYRLLVLGLVLLIIYLSQRYKPC